MIVLRAEIELEAGKICLLALEIAFHGGDGLGHLRRGRAGFYAGRPAEQQSFVASGLLVGNWKRVMPTLFRARSAGGGASGRRAERKRSELLAQKLAHNPSPATAAERMTTVLVATKLPDKRVASLLPAESKK
jgi:hypothetical protein